MIGMDLRQAQRGFFDVPKVTRAVDAATRKVLSKFGAFVRRRARSSIRKRKAVSAPGDPPSSHRGWLRQHIYFAYDFAQKSVVTGPIQLGRGTAPKALEHGGPSTGFRRFKSNGQWFTAMREIAYIRPRPFMQPAFEAELPNAPRLWRDAVR
jgi:hypothetical protein